MALFWKVFETVTQGGHYIVWPDSYTTEAGATRAIQAARSSAGARAVLCRTGEGKGPIPLERE